MRSRCFFDHSWLFHVTKNSCSEFDWFKRWSECIYGFHSQSYQLIGLFWTRMVHMIRFSIRMHSVMMSVAYSVSWILLLCQQTARWEAFNIPLDIAPIHCEHMWKTSSDRNESYSAYWPFIYYERDSSCFTLV